MVGSLDEDFAVESMVGDVFLLGTTRWRIRRVEPGRVRVEDAHGAAPSIPFWRGEAPGRTRELSLEVSRLREDIVAAGLPLADARGSEAPILNRDLRSGRRAAGTRMHAGPPRRGAGRAIRARGPRRSGRDPHQDTVVAERFFDEAGGMQFVLHAPFGSRINRAWGLALRKRFCRTFNFELQAAATDNGLVLSLSDQHSFPLELVFSFLTPAHRGARPDAGHARFAYVRRALEMERRARAGRAALRRRTQSPSAHPAHARRRSARRGVSRIRSRAPKI